MIVEVEDVSVDYRRSRSLWRKAQRFRALDRVTFDIREGDSVGIIGRNGAGKSTLLRALAGIVRPSSGTVRSTTESITLLALGVGYEAALSADANVVMNGLLLGMRKREVEAKLDAIFDFAELTNFRDQPIKTYSSGMRSRLAFATTVYIQPDVLLIDEILAVGDRDFRAKSAEVMRNRVRSGQTVVLVSHQTRMVARLCERAIWLDQGRVLADGPVREVVRAYETS